MPASVHAQVRSQEKLARKFDDQVFSGRSDALHFSAAKRRLIVDAGKLRQHGFEPRDHFAGERAIERARGAKDRVAFRHFQFIPSAGGWWKERGILRCRPRSG